MPPITSRTTTEEVQAIVAEFTGPSGVNYSGMADAIQNWTPLASQHDIEDLLTAYYLGTGNLPPFMAPSASIPITPDSEPELFSIDVLSSLQELAATRPTDAALSGYIQYIENTLGPIGLAEAFLAEEAENVDDEPGILDLFRPEDLREVISLFLRMGNPGLALLLYTANGLAPAMQELQDAAIEVIEEAQYELEEKLGDLEDVAGMDPEEASAQTARLNSEMGIINSIITAMTQFITNAQESVNQTLQASSELSRGSGNVLDTIIRNMA